MSKTCDICGKRRSLGYDLARRGLPKKKGGVGRKITGKSRRKFKPNIQRVRAIIDGKVCRIHVSAKAIRMGLLVKPIKRTWKPEKAKA